MVVAPPPAPSAHPSFYDLIASSLSFETMTKLDAYFDAYEVVTDGHRFRVGPVMREAWKAEVAIPPTIAKRAAALFAAIIEGGDLTEFPGPTCCHYHNTFLQKKIDPRHYPQKHEMLKVLADLMWIFLPELRGILPMAYPGPKTILTSRFMLLEAFIKCHDKSVIQGWQPPDVALSAYAYNFGAQRPPKLRQWDLRNIVRTGDLIGIIGAFPDLPAGKPHAASWCEERRPFSTPIVPIRGTDRKAIPPDRLLRSLGMEFRAGELFVELMYNVRIEPLERSSASRASVPTIVDAEGYWLYRPDRSAVSSQLTWNYSRDVETNRRGRRELIASKIEVSELLDIIVWPCRTTMPWFHGAENSIGKDLEIII